MKLIETNNSFNINPYWSKPLGHTEVPDISELEMFDQNGYDLTSLELDYAFENVSKRKIVNIRQRRAIAHRWFVEEAIPTTGAHLNHAWLFERKGYDGKAREQLEQWAYKNHYIYKLLKMRPKWGIDISIDYVDENQNVFEVFHYEWDDFDPVVVEKRRREVSPIIVESDWNEVALKMLERRSEWQHLGFFEQSKWKSDYIGLPPEQFKMVIWDQ